MTYTCFPNQTPFPLPPGVTTPPTSPTFTDNGPQAPPNSVEAADDLDLCSLVELLDSLPDDEIFVPEQEDPDSPILPPYQETFYVEAPIRVAGSWFYIPGPVVLDQGAITAVVKAAVFAGAPIGASVRIAAQVESVGIFFKIGAAIRLEADATSAVIARVAIIASCLRVGLPGAGVAFGLAVSKP